MPSAAELLAEAAAALVKAAVALSGDAPEPTHGSADGEGPESEVVTPRSMKGSDYRDFPRLVQQMRKGQDGQGER